MASSDQSQLQAINQTAESLSSCERRRLFYLCEMLDTDNSVSCMKEMLKSKVMCGESGYWFLAELMLRLRRFDILKKVYKTSRQEVEEALKHGQVLSRFRVLMANINEDMEDKDVSNLKFLCSTWLPRDTSEKAKSFLDVIIELEKLDLVSPESVDFLEERLRDISRVDLAKKVSAYKMSVVTPGVNSSQQQRHIVPRASSFPCSSNSVQPIRQTQSLHIARENMVPVYRVPSRQSQLDCYKFNTNPRGVCVIIDCVGNDGDMLEETFKALHFKVFLHKWLSVIDTFAALRQLSKQRENLQGDGFVCCIISRGATDHLLGTDSYGAGLRLDDVRRLFTADACPMLAGKPKLFFIQRYGVPEYPPHERMEHRDEDLETDGCDGLSRCALIPTDADVFWSHCWTDDGQLERGQHRSVYLKALTDALHKGQSRKMHLVDVHTEVNGAIFDHNTRNPGADYHIDLKHTLRKELYLS
ncbi:CASP8 and FADD-like apoptosis regulator [Centropristis striata]|uniref:CASP8 and FADD-like apoptosis regulator n=1 Tax=Centropristis striata TaxID=184440 RepID=UPI0027E1D3C0|nr:CASP8 and FADD-like apoptosis regulator [Centropristis striata]